MPVRRDVPWQAAPPDGPWQVVLPAELPVLRPLLAAHLYRVPGRVLGRTRRRSSPASRHQ